MSEVDVMDDYRALKPAEHIDACATCGYQAWREGYPCNRCGGVESIRYVPDTQLRGAVEAVRKHHDEWVAHNADRASEMWPRDRELWMTVLGPDAGGR